jgi:predicted nucleic acid-binding protein
MQAVEIIGRLPFEFVCPVEVEKEILAGAERGYEAELPKRLKVEKLRSPLSPLTTASLDVGEAAVIQLALDRKIEIVCIDELKRRRAAAAVGLKIIGSPCLLGRAKVTGMIPKIKPFIEKARNNGIFYDQKLIQTFLRFFGE